MNATLGIDLASQPPRTALCVIDWSRGRAAVRVLARGAWRERPLDDDLLAGAISGVTAAGDRVPELGRPLKVAIDAPLGWPEPFVAALRAHQRLEPWPSRPDDLIRRETDRFVHCRARKLPLSVSTDRIAYCAMRCARILSDVGERLGQQQPARDRSGPVAEAYPDAALRRWLPAAWPQTTSYKGDGEAARARREQLLAALLDELGSGFAITGEQREHCERSDDCLDALVCALLARAVDRGLTTWPETAKQRQLARTEGWIHLPEPGGLGRLL